MSEWKEYSGSDEQIEQIKNAPHGFIYRLNGSTISSVVFEKSRGIFVGEWVDCKRVVLSIDDLRGSLNRKNVTHYFLINPHPLADMICQQARTGQPVWISIAVDTGIGELEKIEYRYLEPTETPDWNIPNAEYSFTPFDS